MISAGTLPAQDPPADLTMTKEKETDGGDAVEIEPIPEAVYAPSVGVAGKNGQLTQLVHVTTVKSMEISEDRVVRVKLTFPIFRMHVSFSQCAHVLRCLLL